jgi:transcriptional regulatory protein LevR
MRHDEPEIYLVAKRIADYVDSQLDTNSNDDELFYLMIYVKRIVNKMNTQA